MNKKIKLILTIIFICTINIPIFSDKVTTEYYWESSYELPTEHNLQDLTIPDYIYANSGNIDTGNHQYKGYYMGELTIDFDKGIYKDYFKDKYKNINLTAEGGYFYNPDQYIYGGRTIVSDTFGNKSTVSSFINMTRIDKNGTVLNNAWFSLENAYNFNISDQDGFKETKTDTINYKYYFVINHIEDLNSNGAWTLEIPSKNGEWTAAMYRLYVLNASDLWGADTAQNDCISKSFYQDNPIYNTSSSINVGTSSGDPDVYSLNVTIEKVFDDDENFFDGDVHDYYSLTLESFKYGITTNEAFSIVLQITSAHNWYLHLDNIANPIDSEKVGYELYLNYIPTSSNPTNILVKDNQEKFLIQNIKSSSPSRVLLLKTKSNKANAQNTTKGNYQDTVYLNFITDGWTASNANNFADTVITLQ